MNAAQFDSIVSLLKKRLRQPLTSEETALLNQWLAKSGENQLILRKLDDPAIVASEMQLIAGAGESIFTKILEQVPELAEPESERSIPLRTPLLRRSFVRYAAAAVVLLATGTFWWLNRQQGPQPQPIVSVTKDSTILPGRSGAILTLADGSQVVLDSMNNGQLAKQNGSEVIMQDGRLIYDPATPNNAEILYNTMTTPRGRQFEITLPDGTHVWLNAASSIRYPAAFVEQERKVEVTGEAYFEVARNEKMPFRVKVNDRADIAVLGTHFNVNAYENEGRIQTTLLEGSIKVNGTIIKPGQQAVTGSDMAIRDVDPDKAIAWKNGLFNFDGLTFDEIMRQLERWYDIRIVYDKNTVHGKRLAGEMTRGVSLNGLLEYFGSIGLNYQLNGRTLSILP